MPSRSNRYDELYAKAWDPSKFSTSTCADTHNASSKPSAGKPAGKGEKVKIYATPGCSSSLLTYIVGNFASSQIEVV